MKKLKKSLLALGTALFLLIAGFLIFSTGHKVFAAGATSAQDVIACGNSLKFVNIAQITCTTPEGTVTFTDPNPSDGGVNSRGHYNVNYVPDGIFCSVSGLGSSQGDTYLFGVNRRDPANQLNLSDAGQPIDIKLNVGYSDPSSGKCTRIDSSHQDYTIPGSRTQGISNLLTFTGNGSGLSSFPFISGGSLNGKNYSLVNGYSSGSTVAYQQGFDANKCSGDIVLVNASDHTATRYTLNGDNKDLSSYPELLNFLNSQSAAGCYIHESQTNFGLGSGSFGITGSASLLDNIAGNGTVTTCDPTTNSNCVCSSQGCTVTGTTTTPTTTPSDTSNTCELKSNGLSLAWLLCPALEAADVFATNLMNVFEDQLPFCIKQAGSHCTAKAGEAQDLVSSQSQVKQAWSIMKNMASAVLIIVMLIIVISQALGEGIIDAYSMRKMLPRLVAAAILIQLSWIVAVWVIDLVNDIGIGLGDLMAAPFGGAKSLSFGALLSQAGVTTLKGGIFIGWLGGALAVILGVALLPSLLVAAFTAVLTLLVGLAVLIFRKILIIALLIFSPIALISWILPNQSTQRLWKMWQENFTKVLAMFPIVVVVIEAGRIFAHITAFTNGGTSSSFIKFWFVMAGYFLPLFILPRAYKWGGSMMNSAGSAIGGLQSSVQKAANPAIKQWGFDTYTGKRASQYDPDKKLFQVEKGDKKLLFGKGPYRPRFSGRFFNSVEGGRLLWSSRARAKMKKRGQAWSATMAEEKDADVDSFSRTYQKKGLSPEQQKAWDDEMVEAGGQRIFGKQKADGSWEYSPMDGIGAGKWSLEYMYFKALQKGDNEMMKSIIKYHLEHKSLLELANGRFRLPEIETVETDRGKERRMVWKPFMDNNLVIDQVYKSPQLWSAIGGMRGGWTPNNWPKGGNRFRDIYAAAGFSKLPSKDGQPGEDIADFDVSKLDLSEHGIVARMHEAFGGKLKRDAAGRLELDEHGNVQIDDLGATPTDRPYLAWKIRDFNEDFEGDLLKKGNSAVSTLREVIGLAEGTWFDGNGAAPAVAVEAIDSLLKIASTASGISSASVINTPAVEGTFQQIIDIAKAQGMTQFVDILGRAHDLTDGADLLRVSEQAIQTRQALLQKDPNAQIPSVTPHLVGTPRPQPPQPPVIAGGGHPDDEYPAYTRPDGTVEPAIPAAGARTAPAPASPAVSTLSGVSINLAPGQTLDLHGANVNLQGVQAGLGTDMYQRRESESMRNELREIYLALKKLGVRTQEQQQQFEQIRREHPDWDREDAGGNPPPAA